MDKDLHKKERQLLLSSLINEEIEELLAEEEVIIAGGVVRSVFSGDPINDVDIYCRSEVSAARLTKALILKCGCTSWTEKSAIFIHHYNKETVLLNVVWFKYFQSPEEVFSAFDFTCVMGAFDFRDEEFYFHERFFKDNMAKRLVYSPKNYYPFGSVFRIKKYEERGFSISKKELAKILVKCLAIEIKTVDQLEDQLGTMYGIKLGEVFEGVEELDYDTIMERLESIECLEAYEAPELHNDVEDKWRKKFSYKQTFKKFGNVAWSNDFGVLEFKEAEIEDEEITFPFSFYKYVREVEDGKYESFWNSSFKYVDNEIVEDNGRGIWVGLYEEIKSLNYKREKDSVLIEISVERPEDIKRLYDGPTEKQIFRGRVVGKVKEQ